jgi:hypothetical protein
VSGLKSAAVGGVAGVALAVTAVALGGSGVGGVFSLGADNTVNKTTTLRNTSSFSGPQLQVKNTSGGPALNLQVASGKPPLTVNSSARVTNLNADTVDGTDSSQLLRGPGRVVSGSVDLGINESIAPINPRDPTFAVGYDCPASPGMDGQLWFLNQEPNTTVDLYVDKGGTDPLYSSFAAGDAAYTATAPSGEFVTYRAQWSNGKSATIWVATRHQAVSAQSSCHAQAQAVTSR